MPLFKRSKAARKTAGGGKRITAKQKAARKRNMAIARAAKKKGTKKHFKKEYQSQRAMGMPKNIARDVAWGALRNR